MSAMAVLKLQRAGFTETQVEALAEYLDQQAATKGDVQAAELRLREYIAEVRTELKEEIAAVRSELKEDIAAVRSESKADNVSVRMEIADLRAEMQRLEYRITFRLGGLMVFLTGVILATMRFMLM